MIYWPTNGDAISWHFPNNLQLTEDTLPDELLLELRNDVGRWLIDGDIDPQDITPGFITYGWEPGEDPVYPPTGEYTYTLWAYHEIEPDVWDDGIVISKGLCIVGEYDEKPQQIENENEHIQYEQFGENFGI